MDDLAQLALGLLAVIVPSLLLIGFVWRFGTPRAGWPGSRLRWAVVTVLPVPAALCFLGGASLWWGSGSQLGLAFAVASLAVLIAGLAWGVVPRRA